MSARFLKSALKSVDQWMQKNSDTHAFATKANYTSDLKRCMRELHQLGSNISHIKDLKPKQITQLITHWQKTHLSIGTIKNRLSKIRFVFNTLNKNHCLPKNNRDLGLSQRNYIPEKNKAINHVNFNLITDPYIASSLKLQQLFGLRREESIKFKPHLADHGHYIELQPSWTKGGIGRQVPITSPLQRKFLTELKQLIPKNQSLIPFNKNYRQQLNTFVTQTRNAGLKNCHGLRHAYAQNRYQQLTQILSKQEGWLCPMQGGKKREALSSFEKYIDRQARQLLSYELGHSRIAITKIYCG